MINTARELMTITPRTASPDTGLPEIARLMRDLDVGMIPICGRDGALVAVVTDRDLVVRGLAEDVDLATATAADLATGLPVTVGPDADIDDVLATMADHQLRRLPVVENGLLIGIISEADVAREGNTEEVADTVQAVTSVGHLA